MKKRYALILFALLFLTGTVFAGEPIIGGGYFNPAGSESFPTVKMNTVGCEIVASALSGQDFNHTHTGRTYIDCDGVMRGLGLLAKGAEYDSDYYGLESELLTDTGIESWTGDDPDSFTVVETGASLIKDETNIVRSGSHSCKAEVASTNAEVGIYQLEAFTEMRVYLVSIWIYGSAGKSVWVRDTDTGVTGGLAEEIFAPAGTWTNYVIAFKANSNSDRIYVRNKYAGVPSAWNFYVDDISCKEATMGVRVEEDGVLLEPMGANFCLRSRNFTTSPWTTNTDLTKNEVGVDGVANRAWTSEDDAGSHESFTQSFESHGPSETWVASIFIKKTTSASTFPGFGINVTGGSPAFVTVDTDNGTLANYSGGAPDDSGVIDTGGDFWRVWAAKNVSGGTGAAIYVYPAVNADATGTWVGATTGSAVFDAAQMEIGVPYANSSIGTSYVNNDDVAASSDLGTDSDCSGGTLTMGTGWTHDAVNDEYDCTAGTLNLTDTGLVELGKVYRVKSVWGNITAGGVTVRCAGNGSEEITANGTYYHYLVAAGDGDLTFDATTAFTGSLQSYEIVEYGSVRWGESSNLTFDLPDDRHFFRDYWGHFDPVDSCQADNTANWTKTNSTLTFDAGNTCYDVGYVANDQYAYLPAAVPGNMAAGTLVRIAIAVRDGTSSGVSGSFRMTDASHNVRGPSISFTTSATWQFLYGYGVLESGCTGVEVYSTMTGAGNFEIYSVNVNEVTNPRDSGDGTYGAHGTSIIWWKPGYDRADGISANYFLSTHGGGGGMMIYTPTAGDPESAPGGTEATVALAFTKDTFYKLAVKWGYFVDSLNKYRIGYDSGSGIVWGTEQIYDGSWRVGTTLILGRGIANPFHIKRVWIYDSILTDAELNALPGPTE